MGAITSPLVSLRSGAVAERALPQHFALEAVEGVRGVRAPVMSHFHKLFIDWLRGVVSQRSLSLLSAPLIYMEMIIFVPAVQSVIMVSEEKEMEHTMRDQRFYHLSVAQECHLFNFKLA